MTEMTKKAIEKTLEIYGDADIIWEDDWYRRVRTPQLNATLKTVAKYIGYEKRIHYVNCIDDGDSECIEEWTESYVVYVKKGAKVAWLD